MPFVDNTALAEVWAKCKALVNAHTADVVQTLTSGTKIGSVDGTDLYAPSGGGGGTYTLPPATNSTLGGVIVPATEGLWGYDNPIDVDSSGNITLGVVPVGLGGTGVQSIDDLKTALGWKVETKNSWRVETLPSGEKIATRTLTGSVAATTSYGGRYISALQTTSLPTGVFSSVDYANVSVFSSPGLWFAAQTAVSTSEIKYYIQASSSLTQSVTRKIVVRGH